MSARIDLEVTGIDLGDDHALDRVESLARVEGWWSQGARCGVVLVASEQEALELPDGAWVAWRAAALACAGVEVVGPRDERVDRAGIRARLAVPDDVVAAWAADPAFPAQGASGDWSWPAVNAWLAGRGLDDGFTYLA